jgi:hypothetical protein
MTLQWDDDAVSSEQIVYVWSVRKVHIIVWSTDEALSSEPVPDLVLSYVFTYNVEGHLS